MLPTRVFLTKGVGVHKEELISFEMALRRAGIANCNIVKVSSSIPPRCKVMSKKDGTRFLKPGQIIHSVFATAKSCKGGEKIAASVGLATSKSSRESGYVSMYAGPDRGNLSAYTRMLAVHMFLSSNRRIRANSDLSEDLLSHKELRYVDDATESAQVEKGKWTTVIACAVFLFNR